MNIILYKGCCTKGIKELLHLTRTLDLKGIKYELHVTTKNGLVGQKALTKEQQDDNNVYIKTDEGIIEVEEWLKKL
jgi:hypothetical protein